LAQIRRPSPSQIEARLASSLEFSYPEVGATASFPQSLASTYDVDRHRFRLGTGRDVFERSRQSLLEWRHFDVSWVEFYGASEPVRTHQVVATLVSIAGIWFLNPCRVVYTEVAPPEGDVAAFAYGTLDGHAERGEERFQVSYDPTTGEVAYEITAFSRPALLLSRLAYPLARRIQRRFAVNSAEALARAAA